jgi:predicted dienelactone hydrolase
VTCRSALILFSHGHEGRPSDYSTLLAHLASEGFAVLAPHHPDAQHPGHDEIAERPGDLRYLLDHLTPVAERLNPGLATHIDRRRVGTAGHSFGGYTAASLAATDRRIRADLVMAGGTRTRVARTIRVPTLALAGADDRLITANQVGVFAASLPAGTPHGFLVIRGAGHDAYGDDCARRRTCAIAATYATSFFLTYLDGVRGAGGPLDRRQLRDARLSLRTTGMPPG